MRERKSRQKESGRRRFTIALGSLSSAAFENAANQSRVTFWIFKSGGTIAPKRDREGNSCSGMSVHDTIVDERKEWRVDGLLCDGLSLSN